MKHLIITIILFVFVGFSANAQNWNFSATVTDETCYQAGDGSVDITMSGTTAGFTFEWEVFDAGDNSEATGIVGNDNPDLDSFLDQGDYTVVVTKQGITESREREVTIDGASSNLSVSKTVTQQNVCKDGNSGIVEITATGGSGTYEYGLGTGTGSTGPSASYNFSDNGGVFEALSAGTYRAWVRDEFGCIVGNTSGDFAITEPSAITMQYDTINASCSNTGGQIDITGIAGGTPFAPGTSGPFNYQVEWFDAESNQLSGFDNEATLSGLDSGRYSVIITDKNGCTGSQNFEIFSGFNFEQNGLQNVSCKSKQDGAITVRIDTDSQSDEEPFELRIYDGDNNEIVTKRKTGKAPADTIQFKGLGPGTYTIIVEAVTGCEREIEVTLTEPSAPKVDDSEMTPVVCKEGSDGSILLTVSGGSGSYRASSDGGTTYPHNSDGNNQINITGLTAGTYDLWIQDESNCPVDVANVEVTEPDRKWGLTKVAETDITCFGAKDGVATWKYTNTDASYSTTPLVDADDIVWTNINTGDVLTTGVLSITDLEEGAYQVTVTAQSGCQRTLTFDIGEPEEVTITGTAPKFDCPLSISSDPTNIVANVQGGTQPYSYEWKNNGDALTTETTDDQATQTTLGNIEDNTTYSLFVTDAYGCEADTAFTVEIPDEIEVTLEEQVNVACKGDSTGSLNISVTGGTKLGNGSYNFNWSKDGTSDFSFNDDLSDLLPGEYQVTVTDRNDCEQVWTESWTITEPSTTYTLSGTATPVKCNGASDGEISLSINLDSGHPSMNTITWTKDNAAFPDGDGQVLLENLGPGTYQVTTVDNDFGCEKQASFVVQEFNELLINASVTQNLCFNESNGSIAINPSGGSLPGGQSYEVRWYKNNSLDATNDDLLTYSSLEDATYRVEVTDDVGCKKTQQIILESPDEIAVTESTIVNVACKGDATGSIDLTITGGVQDADGGYQLVWTKDGGTFPQITEDLSKLEAGEYELTITDENDCSIGPLTYNVTEPSTTYSISGTATPVICNGEDNGKIEVTLNRDTGHPFPESIEWTKDGEAYASNQLSLNNGDLSPGTYVLTTEDEFGCVRTASFEIEEYPELKINATATQNECFGDVTADLSISPSGGYLGTNANYSIRWFKDGNLESTNNNEDELLNQEDGIYRIRVEDSVGCVQDTTITLEAPEPVSATANERDIFCRGDETGYIALDITGGTEPYIITWKDSNGTAISNEDSIFDLSPGDYSVIIEDQNDCDPFEATYTITEPATDYSISLDPTEIQCVDELSGTMELVIDASAVHPDNYTVRWFKDGASLSSGQTDVARADMVPIENLGPGNYSVEVTDDNGCERTASYELTNPTQIYFRPEIDSVTCHDLSDGKITIDPTGGYGDFSVQWESEDQATFADNDFELSNIPGDKYTITLTDAQGCEIDTTIFLSNPSPIVVTHTITDPTCLGGENGAIDITVANGTPPYAYQWLTGGQLISTEQNIANLAAGTYELIITDQLQCEFTKSDYVVEDPPSEFFIEGEVTKVQCNDDLNGAIDVSISIEGDPDLDYEVYWEKDGELFSQNTEDLSGVGAGAYELFVEDQYGCIKSRLFNLENPVELAFTFEINNVSCFEGADGSVSAQVNGGYGSYAYSWKKDGEDLSNTSSFLTNLEAAFYEITVTDLEGCTLTRTVEVDEPEPFQISLTSESNTCATPFDSEIDATVTGGVPPYSLQWFKDGLPYAKTEDLNAIPAGTYQLMATDTNFCETNSVEVVITAPERLNINVINLEDNLCPNTQNGSLSVQGTGGTFPYTYSFDSAAYNSVNNFVNLEGRPYLVSVQDDVGCTFDTLIRIGNQYQLEPEFSLTTEEFAIDFPITLTDESLGEGIVSWFWDFGDTRASEEQNTEVVYDTPGTYALQLTVENEVGCSLSKVDTLEIVQGYNFEVPTAFTPNGDGRNENFRPGFQNVQELTMRIQDRNGLLVYESDALSANWDGTFNGNDVPQGPYYYEIIFTAKSGKVRTRTGKIVVLR